MATSRGREGTGQEEVGAENEDGRTDERKDGHREGKIREKERKKS